MTGELRSVNQLGQRVSEIQRLGFRRCVVPAHRAGTIKAPTGLTVIPARNIGERSEPRCVLRNEVYAGTAQGRLSCGGSAVQRAEPVALINAFTGAWDHNINSFLFDLLVA